MSYKNKKQIAFIDLQDLYARVGKAGFSEFDSTFNAFACGFLAGKGVQNADIPDMITQFHLEIDRLEATASELYDNMPVIINEEAVPEVEFPRYKYVKDDTPIKHARLIIVTWIATEVAAAKDQDYDEVYRNVDKMIKIEGDHLGNLWHNCVIYPGDLIELDVYNDIFIVNGERHTHD